MSAPKFRILYSEDDFDHREIISLMLAEEGFETICPETPEEALRLAQQEQFDLYLLDTWTPGMSGLALCRKIREFDGKTPVIFYSADALTERRNEAIAAGAQAYITKPSNFDEVVKIIRDTIFASHSLI